MSLATLLTKVGLADDDESLDEEQPGSGLARLLQETGAPADPGLFPGLANTARRGLKQAGQAIDAGVLAVGAKATANADREAEKLTNWLEDNPAPRLEDFSRYGDMAESFHQDAVKKWEFRAAEMQQRLGKAASYSETMRGEHLPALAASIGRRQQEIEALPRSAAMRAWDEAEGLNEALRVLAKNPVEVVGNLAVSGLTAGAPALALGAAGSLAGPAGTAAGAGLGSFAVEYGGKIVEELQAAGADFEKPETVLAVFQDPEKSARIRKKATARGVPVAVLDALSAGLAGKLVAQPAKSVLGKVGRGAAEAGVQAGLGGLGEVAGSVAAGDEISGKAILEEMIGELGSGVGEVATGVIRDRSMRPAMVPGEANTAEAASGVEGQAIDAETATVPATKSEPIWRQMNAGDLGSLLAGKLPAAQQDWFAADLRELALGQGQNRDGILAEFDASGLQVAPAPGKPSLAHIRETTGQQGEVLLPLQAEDGSRRGNTGKALQSALAALEMTEAQYEDTQGPQSPGTIARELEKKGWSNDVTSEGMVRLERPTELEPASAEAKRLLKKPKLGDPAETIADAINARPDEHFKADLGKIEGADVDLVGQLARYGEMARKTDEDFAGFAERMTKKLGVRVRPYLPMAWDAISGDRPVRELVPDANPLKVDDAFKRGLKWGRLFWEGSADVLRRAGVHSLADAVDRHVDFADRNQAQAWGIIKPTVEKFQGLTGAVNRGRFKQVFSEFEAFYRARENGRMEEAQRIFVDAHPETKKVVKAVEQMFIHTGRENRRLGVRVRDRKGQLRPIGYLGKDNFPRMLKKEIQEVLRDPASNPKRWKELQAELVQNGNIKDRQEAGKFVTAVAPAEASNDHFGSLEKGRAARLPEDWYEYDFWKVVPRYVASWAERTAQIEAFGQKIAETDRDAFDVALANVRNPETRRYIEATRDHAYRVSRMSPTARKSIGNTTAGAAALFLGNPYSALRNLVGGTAQTVNHYGLMRSLAALPKAWQAIDDAQAVGAVKADVMDLMFHDDGSPIMQRIASGSLKLGGFQTAETFVRAHNYLTAKSFLGYAERSLRENPQSRRSLQTMAFLRRQGINTTKLMEQGMQGPEAERFLRKAVRTVQGGYRYDQVPLFTDSALGRFLFQFARYGTQAARFHAQHVIKPAVIGEEVPVKVGDRVEMRRVRTLLPLLRSPFVAMMAGASTFALREALFGIDQADPSWDEIFRTLEEDEQRAIELALSRVGADIIMGGTFGAMSDYTALLRDAVSRSRFKNPVEPPAVAILEEVGLLGYKLMQQGRLSKQDYREFASRLVSAYRYGSAMTYRFANAMDADWKAAHRYQAEQDKRFIASITRRFAEDAGMTPGGRGVGGLPNVNENSPFYDELEDALMEGDAWEVGELIIKRWGNQESEAERKKILQRLRTSALARQPVRIGGRYGQADQLEFRLWMRRRLGPEEIRRIEDAQRRYFRTGIRAGLFTEADLARYAPDVDRRE